MKDFVLIKNTGLSVLGIMALSSCQTKLETKQKQPNIIYILADDLGYAELGCYGQKQIETPNIDKLAENGIRFTQHYSGTAVSAPSRCVLPVSYTHLTLPTILRV